MIKLIYELVDYQLRVTKVLRVVSRIEGHSRIKEI